METYTCSPLAANSRIRDAYWANKMPCDVALALFGLTFIVGMVVAYNL